ncbi:MAG TPA: glycosyl hydrolase [Acidisarcina sp.]
MITHRFNSSAKNPPLAIIVIALFAALMLIITSGANWMPNLSAHKQATVKARASTSASASHSGAFEMETSNTTASLRGIHAVPGTGVAWASGANGTVLRTEDSGYVWQTCAVPPGAEKLDFRAIWGWEANTAVAMSSGPGDQSRLYKTTDGCSHWKLTYANPDPKGFWDAMAFDDSQTGTILGDPVDGSFKIMNFADINFPNYRQFQVWAATGPTAVVGQAAFAASNSALIQLPDSEAPNRLMVDSSTWVGVGGTGGSRVFRAIHRFRMSDHEGSPGMIVSRDWLSVPIPLASGTDSSGVFSLAFRDPQHGMAAGGDYAKPNDPAGTAAWTADGGKTWTAATKPPHGYRSAVAWDEADKLWITVGTNGADISRDDGRTWTPIDNGNWNAISLPWVVSPTGRIAKLISLNLRQTKP